MYKKFAIFILLFSLMAKGQVTQQMTIESMRLNILETDKAIEETKKKIKSIRDAKFLPDLYMALAEFYITKSKLKYNLTIAENPKKSPEDMDFSWQKRIKQQTIEVFDIVIDRFPKYEDRDKAIFYKAHELREMGQLEEMITVYNQLTKEYPNSDYWKESQIIIGDYYFETKKDIETALEVFKKLLKGKTTAYTALAHYKIGWCYVNKDDFYKALLSFELVIKKFRDLNLTELPPRLKKTDVREDALTSIVWPLLEIDMKKIKKPNPLWKRPIEYLKFLAPTKSSYRKALRKLGRRQTIKKQFSNATKAYFELLTISSDYTDKLDLIYRVYESMKNSNKTWPVKGFVYEAVHILPEIKYSESMKKNEKKKAFFDLEIFTRDMATRQDKQARIVTNKIEWDFAIEDYRYYLRAFPKTKFTLDIKKNLATVFYLSGHYAEAGKANEELTRIDKSQSSKYQLAAIDSYIEALKDPESLTPLELTESRYGLRQVGNGYIKKNPRSEYTAKIMFNIGQSYYDERLLRKTIKQFGQLISKYPRDANIETAVNLTLDSYNLLEDYKGLIKASKGFLANKNIDNPSLKSQIEEILTQAEMRLVQKDSGDADGSGYASNLLKLASKYKGSSLGDKALYEAFMAYKSKKDPRAYEVGTELALKHKNSKYALPVITDIGKLALDSADYKKAALYFELFFERFPRKSESKDLILSAAQMRELLGDYKIAAEDFGKVNKYTDAARMDFKGRFWTSLVKSSTKAQGLWKHYYGGIAQYRLKGLSAARSSLMKAANSSPSTPEEMEAVSHAIYLLSSADLKNYKSIQITLGNEAKAVNAKATRLKELEGSLGKIIQLGSGRWTIAALNDLGRTYNEFASFLINSPTPKGLSGGQKSQYRAALKQQASQYSQAANNYFKQCLTAAEKSLIFTAYVDACRSKGKKVIDEKSEMKVVSRARKDAPSGAKAIQSKLLDNPKDIKLLNKLATLYVKARDYSGAELVLSRMLELEPENGSTYGKIGIVKIHKNELQEASGYFNTALSKSSSDRYGLYGKAALLKKFKYTKTLSKMRSKVKSASKPSDISHPWMNGI